MYISPPTTIPINITGKKITVQSSFIIPQDALNPNIKNFKKNKYLLLARNLKEKAIYIMYSILGLEFTAKLVSKLYVIKSRFENLERNK